VNAVVFLGPTLAQEHASGELRATYLPPVAQGDILRATREAPFAIGIIDGYFDRMPAVWHKEILWALSRGIHVFGAASMGALRATELAPFGMRGVGAIYEAFQTGELEDDDEVTVAHGDESTGFRASSEAMVNIRATLHCAEQAGILAPDFRKRLVSLAKDLFYPDRSYPRLFERAQEEGLPAHSLETLQAFVRSNRVDQKRVDALALLQAVRQCCELGAPPPPVRFTFAHTEAWDQVVDWAETQPPLTHADALPADLLAAEVRLSGFEGRAVVAAGMNRAAAGALARRRGVTIAQEQLEALDQAHRKAMGLDGIDGNESPLFECWLSEHGLTRDGYRAFLERQAHFESLRERFHDEVDRHVVDELRVNGTYLSVSQRAREKQELLAKHGLEEPTLKDAGLSANELVSWYFAERLGCPAPKHLEAFLRQIGIADPAALQREALRERMYQRLRSLEGVENPRSD
jgi:hypothetical protein